MRTLNRLTAMQVTGIGLLSKSGPNSPAFSVRCNAAILCVLSDVRSVVAGPHQPCATVPFLRGVYRVAFQYVKWTPRPRGRNVLRSAKTLSFALDKISDRCGGHHFQPKPAEGEETARYATRHPSCPERMVRGSFLR